MERITAPRAAVSALALALAAGPALSQEVEVLHMWSAGEASQEALGLMADKFREAGGEWTDSPISGGTSAQLAALRARVLANNAPAVSQLKGPMIHEWASRGTLASVQELAEKENWDAIIPDTLEPIMKYEGDYVAVPLNIHRINWVYYNPTVLEELGLEFPQNWDEFEAAMDAAEEAGIIPVVHGHRPWQDVTLFESVALGYGGADYFDRAFVQLDMEALGSDTTREVFELLRRIDNSLDEGVEGRHWTDSAKIMAEGDGLFYFMGDWVLGYFRDNGYEYGVDYACEGTPQNDGIEAFTLNTDSFAFFNTGSDAEREGQLMVAAMSIQDEFQRDFNMTKGSIPANTETSLEGFMPCQQQSAEDLAEAMEEGGLVPSFAHGMAQPEGIVAPVTAVVSEFLATDMSAEEAVDRLVQSIQQAS
jgi:glucose/mannose transport system substrate-binding protein